MTHRVCAQGRAAAHRKCGRDRDRCDRATAPSFVDAHAPHGPCVLPLFARAYIDPGERNPRRRLQALGVRGG